MGFHQDNRVRLIHRGLVERIVSGDGRASPEDRLRAFNGADPPEHFERLLAIVATGAGHVTDDDIDRAKRAGATEDQIFELVVCAAVGAATRRYEAGLSALARTQANQQDG